MSRRALTLLLAGLLAVGLTLAAAVQTVPYVSLGPGPAYDTLGSVKGTPVIVVKGRPTYPTRGRLNLLTVSVRDQITLAEALKGWLSRHEQVVPREVLYAPDQTTQQVDKQNAADMRESQDAATTAALGELGLTKVTVAAVPAGSPATGLLRPGDVLTAVDGTQVSRALQLRDRIGRHKPGEQVQIGYLRGGVTGTATIRTAASTDKPPHPVIGVQTSEVPTVPVTVSISLRDVGGPSAGMMFALGITDKLTPGSLTGGLNIAGTGEISADGAVGPIGGTAEKMEAAASVGAKDFLIPAANCADAKGHVPSGMRLAKVSTLRDALAALSTFRAGGTPPGC